jgi:hypothetical protein
MCTAATVHYLLSLLLLLLLCSPDVRASLSLATMGATLRELGEEGVDNGMKTTRTVSFYIKQYTILHCLLPLLPLRNQFIQFMAWRNCRKQQ